MILSQAVLHQGLHAFSIRGQHISNEFKTAAAIADALQIPIMPMVREFDHYADSAELGVQVSGGMGSMSSNHFLGFRNALLDSGCTNLVTGCYFDYLFKSLSVDSRETTFLRRERLTDYRVSSYLPYFSPAPKHHLAIKKRLASVGPDDLQSFGDEMSRLQVMARRTFPIWREGDNIQRLVAHRVFGWYSPAVFRSILDVYWQTPIQARLNKSLFKKAVLRCIPDAVKKIPDNNTELPIHALPLLQSLFRYRVALRRRISQYSHKIDTAESWINWAYYLRSSEKVKELWSRASPSARLLVEELTAQPFSEKLEPYLRVGPEYFSRLLTIKLWAEQRES
jgi:hypothetical protein